MLADEIKSWFDEAIYGLYSEIYQRYHLDVCYEISDYQTITDNGICFTIVSPVLEDNSLRVDVTAEYSIGAFVLSEQKASEFFENKVKTSSDVIRRFENRKAEVTFKNDR